MGSGPENRRRAAGRDYDAFTTGVGNVIGTNRELLADGQVSERLQIGLAEMIVRNIGHRGRSRSWRALRCVPQGTWRGLRDSRSLSASVMLRPHNKEAPSQTLGKIP